MKKTINKKPQTPAPIGHAIVTSLPSKTIKPKLSKTELINVMVELERSRRKEAHLAAKAQRSALLVEIMPLLVADLVLKFKLNGKSHIDEALEMKSPGVIDGTHVVYEVKNWLNGEDRNYIKPDFSLEVDSPPLLLLKKKYAAIKDPGELTEWQEQELRRALKKKYMADRAEAIGVILQDSGMREKLEDALDEILNAAKGHE